MKITIPTPGSGSPTAARRMQALGKRLEVELHAHFDRLNSRGNRRGWTRSNFWTRVVKKATSFVRADSSSATVSIASREFIHKLKGGVVRAKAGRALAIPLTNAAKAAGSPGEWTTKGDGQLIFVKTKRGAFLFRNLGFRGRGRTKGQRWEAMYKLVASVRHLAQADALPDRAAIEAALADQLRLEIAAGN